MAKPTKRAFLKSLYHFPDTASVTTSPTDDYVLPLWDGADDVLFATAAELASSGYDSTAIKTAGLQSTLNIGAVSNGTAVEYGDGYHHATVITVTDFTQAIAGANLGFGKKIYTFPEGGIKCKRAQFNITMTAATDTTVGEIGLGTVISSGVVTTLGGTATFEDIVDGFANTAPASDGGDTQAFKECEAGILDGSSTAKDMFLNFAGGWSATENITIGGTIILLWDYLGTF